jgi:hypothetical protein
LSLKPFKREPSKLRCRTTAPGDSRGRDQEVPMTRIALFALVAATLAGCSPQGSQSHTPPSAKPKRPPAPQIAGPLPAPPAWAQPFMGKIITEVLPQKETCTGNADHRGPHYAGPPAGSEVQGWAWNKKANRPLARVLLTDETLRVWGAGEPGGPPRPDIARHLPEVGDQKTGWVGYAAATSGLVVAYALVDKGQAICPLGELEL